MSDIVWHGGIILNFIPLSASVVLPALKELSLYEHPNLRYPSSLFLRLGCFLTYINRWKRVGKWVSCYFGNKTCEHSRYNVSINNFTMCSYGFLIQIWAEFYKVNILTKFLAYRVCMSLPVIRLSIPVVMNHTSDLHLFFFLIFYLISSWFLFLYFPPSIFLPLSFSLSLSPLSSSTLSTHN